MRLSLTALQQCHLLTVLDCMFVLSTSVEKYVIDHHEMTSSDLQNNTVLLCNIYLSAL